MFCAFNKLLYRGVGSDDGRVFIWEKLSGKLIHILHNADSDVVNCVKGHPLGHPIVATRFCSRV